MRKNFSSAEDLLAFINTKVDDSILIAYRNLEGYEGMVLGIVIRFNTTKHLYDLQLEWISFGLDLYAENLLESYTYRFQSLEALLTYLLTKYGIAATDVPVKFEIDQTGYPNPFKDADRKAVFEKDWQRFQDDFRNDLFLDPSIELIDSTMRLGRFIKK